MNKEKLDKILEKHNLWVNDEDGGEIADLRHADLRYADLRYADLRYADLRYADLRSANLRYADLRSANLRYAGIIGITAPVWRIYINRETTSIGCETHSNEEWRNFKDSRIVRMDIKALDWWNVHKKMVFAAMDAVESQEVESDS